MYIFLSLGELGMIKLSMFSKFKGTEKKSFHPIGCIKRSSHNICFFYNGAKYLSDWHVLNIANTYWWLHEYENTTLAFEGPFFT